jgi:hypothetical protein
MYIYTVYQTTNLINNKIYVGIHKTKNINYDYMGSGKLLKSAIEKYGIKNFKKEILHVFDNKEEMYAKEKEIVTKDFCKRLDTYNMHTGGTGGFNHINDDPEERARVSKIASDKNKGRCTHIPSEKERAATSARNKINFELKIGPYSPEIQQKIKMPSRERNMKISKTMSTDKNAMLGSNFYINILTNEKCRFLRDDIIPPNWIKLNDYIESNKLTNWYHNDTKNYLIKKDDPILTTNTLIKGRNKF